MSPGWTYVDEWRRGGEEGGDIGSDDRRAREVSLSSSSHKIYSRHGEIGSFEDVGQRCECLDVVWGVRGGED